tara:strand:- start:494 stop:1774 length:1281 start_codon:yes stop_codon:yes gene_type:complete
MDDQIYTANPNDFPFPDLVLANPQGLQGGAYFSRLKILEDKILVQMPKCQTKNGIHKTEKKIYCDLMFSMDNMKLIEWVHKLEDKIKNLIFEKRNAWFHSDMDLDTIEYHWQPILRTYKGSNKLLRCFLKKPKTSLAASQTVQIYDEDEALMQLDDVEKNKSVVAMIELAGLKFTSQSFSIEFHLKQMMVLKQRDIPNRCLIRIQKPSHSVTEHSVTSSPPDVIQSTTNSLTTTKKSAPSPVQIQTTDVSDASNHTFSTLTEKTNEDIIQTFKTSEASETSEISDASENLATILEDPLDNSKKRIADGSNCISDPEKQAETITDKSSASHSLEQNSDAPPIHQESLEKNAMLDEINLVPPEDGDTIQLKKPNEVYLEIYKAARRKAKEAKMKAVQAYLEAKRIKTHYLLEEIESSDDDDDFLEENF